VTRTHRKWRLGSIGGDCVKGVFAPLIFLGGDPIGESEGTGAQKGANTKGGKKLSTEGANDACSKKTEGKGWGTGEGRRTQCEFRGGKLTCFKDGQKTTKGTKRKKCICREGVLVRRWRYRRRRTEIGAYRGGRGSGR